jgi:hypothetical protein
MTITACRIRAFQWLSRAQSHLPCILNILIDGKSLPWNSVAEATDVIGSQSRQEPAGIKHNRYASV